MEYRMIYPVNRWVSAEKLISAAHDAIYNHNLDNPPPTNAQEAIRLLQDLGEVTITAETRKNYHR
jgi:hypothetical protein